METWDTYIPHKLGDTRVDYVRWRAEVLQIRDMSESKLRKLWKLNFSLKDIAQDKHWAIYPPNRPVKRRVAPKMTSERGRTLSAKKKQWIYARALYQAAESILQFYRLDTAMLVETRKELEGFRELMKKFAHKQK